MSTSVEHAATLTVDQAHEELGKQNISRGALYLAIAHNEIPSIRIGRRILIPRLRFEELLRLGSLRNEQHEYETLTFARKVAT